MKKLGLLTVVMGAMISYQSFAMTVDLSRINGYYTSPGGEFNVVLDPSDAGDPEFTYITQNYSSQAIVNGGFETFCINTSIPYNSPGNGTLTSSGITAGTALLYDLFATGNLANYDYTAGTGRSASAWDLQNAIWTLQNQTVYDAAAAAVFLTSSQFTSVFGTLASAEQLNNGAYGAVDELYLTNPTTGGVLQPMLALVPDGGMTVVLLGLALGGIAMFRHRFSRA